METRWGFEEAIQRSLETTSKEEMAADIISNNSSNRDCGETMKNPARKN